MNQRQAVQIVHAEAEWRRPAEIRNHRHADRQVCQRVKQFLRRLLPPGHRHKNRLHGIPFQTLDQFTRRAEHRNTAYFAAAHLTPFLNKIVHAQPKGVVFPESMQRLLAQSSRPDNRGSPNANTAPLKSGEHLSRQKP